MVYSPDPGPPRRLREFGRWWERWRVPLPTKGMAVQMPYSRRWVADILRRSGYQQEADEALRVLPDEVDRAQLEEFGDRHNIFIDEVISQMGGSP